MKSWIVPCNPKYYKIYEALKSLDAIWYRQNLKDISRGDYVYIYVGKPIQAYLYKCLVLDANVSLEDIDTDEDRDFTLISENFDKNQKFMRISLYQEGNVTLTDIFSNVQNINCAPRSQISLKGDYLNYIESHFGDKQSLADKDDEIEDVINVEISSFPAEEKIHNNVSYLPRNERTKQIVLRLSRNKCANEQCNHKLFIKKNDETYLEVHHIIPLSAFKDFPGINIDIPENVVCLCPSCHREIHCGKNAKILIENLYNLRKDMLASKGIVLQEGITKLLSYYNL